MRQILLGAIAAACFLGTSAVAAPAPSPEADKKFIGIAKLHGSVLARSPAIVVAANDDNGQSKSSKVCNDWRYHHIWGRSKPCKSYPGFENLFGNNGLHGSSRDDRL